MFSDLFAYSFYPLINPFPQLSQRARLQADLLEFLDIWNVAFEKQTEKLGPVFRGPILVGLKVQIQVPSLELALRVPWSIIRRK